LREIGEKFIDYPQYICQPYCNYIYKIPFFAQIWQLCGDKGPEY